MRSIPQPTWRTGRHADAMSSRRVLREGLWELFNGAVTPLAGRDRPTLSPRKLPRSNTHLQSTRSKVTCLSNPALQVCSCESRLAVTMHGFWHQRLKLSRGHGQMSTLNGPSTKSMKYCPNSMLWILSVETCHAFDLDTVDTL